MSLNCFLPFMSEWTKSIELIVQNELQRLICKWLENDKLDFFSEGNFYQPSNEKFFWICFRFSFVLMTLNHNYVNTFECGVGTKI